MSLKVSSAHWSAGVVEEFKARSTVNENTFTFLEDHSTIALGSNASLLIGIPLEAFVAAHRETLVFP